MELAEAGSAATLLADAFRFTVCVDDCLVPIRRDKTKAPVVWRVLNNFPQDVLQKRRRSNWSKDGTWRNCRWRRLTDFLDASLLSSVGAHFFELHWGKEIKQANRGKDERIEMKFEETKMRWIARPSWKAMEVSNKRQNWTNICQGRLASW